MRHTRAETIQYIDYTQHEPMLRMDRGPRERLRARSEVRVRVLKFKRVDTEQRRVNLEFGAQMEARPRGKGLVRASNGSRHQPQPAAAPLHSPVARRRGGRVLEGVIKLHPSPPQARKFWRY